MEHKLLKPILSFPLIMLSAILIFSGSTFAQGDNPLVDQVLQEWIPANIHSDSEEDVITINGFDDLTWVLILQNRMSLRIH